MPSDQHEDNPREPKVPKEDVIVWPEPRDEPRNWEEPEEPWARKESEKRG